ncbi:MAG: hypothetical protein EZS28_013439 [Streblomastix strix]|uniref:Uncharacterized protein n=1 Tax=Streblomastix strix TaxID=222440 RepID=A0A5J4W862_9EUKA|nr:MAG: hypothetical protein EZS28_013439 [Streblomastix strix]
MEKLENQMEPFDYWMLQGYIEESDPQTKTDAIRVIRKCQKEMDVDIPSQLEIAAAAECNPSLVSRTLSNKPKKIVEKKESALLSVEDEGKLVEYCLETIEQSGYITPIEIRIEASTMVRREVGHSWHIGFLDRNKNTFAYNNAHPRELARLQIQEMDIESYENTLRELSKSVPCELFLQADEVGYQQYADSRSKKIIVKKEDENKVLHFPIDRSETRLSIMACAALSSDLLKPFLIVKRPLNVDKFLEAGLRDNIDAVLSEADGTTMTASLFLEWLDKVIVPYVTNA